jgi:branched-chain amino acid transport system substrate-binding protein
VRRATRWGALVALLAAAAAIAALAATTGGNAAGVAAKKPIIIGAAVDLSGIMKPFDSAALLAARLRAAQINAKGGVNGRRLKIIQCDTKIVQPPASQAKACATKLVGQGAIALLVTCDVEFAAPATQEAINAGRLALGSCIGTDEQGPKRFGTKGRLAFSFGNVAQDEGAAMAEYAYKKKHWKKAIVVTDKSLVYFRDVTAAFKVRYKALGGKLVRDDSFVQGQNQIPSLVNRIRGTKGGQVIVTSTTFGDWPALVQGLRSLRVNTPLMNSWAGDGTSWYPKNPKVTKYWYVTFASIFGDDPNPAVRKLFNQIKAKQGAPATGSFVTGATAIDALVTAIKRAKGSTKPRVLAGQFEHFRGLPTISGKISFSRKYHTVFGRSYRVIEVEKNKGKYVGSISAGKPANIG